MAAEHDTRLSFGNRMANLSFNEGLADNGTEGAPFILPVSWQERLQQIRGGCVL